MDLASKMNKQLDLLKPSSILKFDADVSQIPDIIKLTLGEPDFNTPEHVKTAGEESIANNQSHYTASAGKIELRKAAANFLSSKYSANFDPETQIVTTVGATGAIYSSITAVINPGDEVLIPIPIFPLYIPIAILNGAKPVFIDTSKDGFQLTSEKLTKAFEEHPNAKALIMNYPTNPTGVTYTRSELEALVAIIKQHEIFVISDEIYSELTYGDKHVSLGELLPEQTLLITGVSKSHAMTGWRIGFVAGPAPVIQKIGMVNQFTVTSATTNAQDAAIEALKNGMDDGLEMKKEYQKRRDFLKAGLEKAGFPVISPDGAFYIFAKIPAQFDQDSFAFGMQLAKEAKVAVIPGAAFPAGEGYLRLSYAASMENLEEAVKRIQHFVDSHK
ncbi:aminotransferase class I/II-fold pyridoxal phosphate-dependent enzyme [Pediococcus argentinicus]|uniref:Aminotransferase n=1 Tax=Pediococcus argentinicus TaxID=480391 RepID=A0A0R2NQH3_9LACO|nr:aminotransferase class I/II-fold pyridoxal phosphate-dependent enzyme [Pediococcus argentinicus]KRO26147.1 aspartate transaminase [Pediococcus argentinicus]NKZ21647.1 aminotransferase class I/II-fold pyridoxal phosphate-dependent enzyme [Pediococcus argentinicus]GEP18766.1 aminotransferase [Pediococcus argentinicus]